MCVARRLASPGSPQPSDHPLFSLGSRHERFTSTNSPSLFSATYELPLRQPLSFDNHTKCPGVGGSNSNANRSVPFGPHYPARNSRGIRRILHNIHHTPGVGGTHRNLRRDQQDSRKSSGLAPRVTNHEPRNADQAGAALAWARRISSLRMMASATSRMDMRRWRLCFWSMR
jgi:hypothetical protein